MIILLYKFKGAVLDYIRHKETRVNFPLIALRELILRLLSTCKTTSNLFICENVVYFMTCIQYSNCRFISL